MRINYGFHPDVAQGYGRMGTLIGRELDGLGVTNLGGIHRKDGSARAEIEAQPGCNQEATDVAPVALWVSTPPHVPGWYEGQLASLYTMWEGSEIPPGFRENLPALDRIFVPSLQCQELYANFHPDVRYVPLGVDPVAWDYRVREQPLQEFRFLTGGAGPRKNCDMVRRAFGQVFGHMLNGQHGGPVPKLTIRAKDAVPGPNITAISTPLSNEQEIDLYAAAHCFVSASCAEGWGLMPNQAIAQGCPTILPYGHGHQAFAHYGIPIGTHPAPAAPGTFYGNNGEWWEPNFDELCEAMQSVYGHYQRYVDRARIASAQCRAEFTWQNTAEQLIFNLPEMWDDAPKEQVWTRAPERLYHVRVTTPTIYVINGRVFRYETWDPENPDTDYYEPADMKMRLGESGALHPSVIDPVDMGVEAANLAAARADAAICPTCKQRLNTNNPLLDLRV